MDAALRHREREPRDGESRGAPEIVLVGGRMLRVPVGSDAAWVGRLAAELEEGGRC